MRSSSRLLFALWAGVLAVVVTSSTAEAVPPAGAPGHGPPGADAGAPAADGGAADAAAPRARPTSLSADATNTCASCHATLTETKLRTPAREFRGSVHRDDRIGCVGCHKGDPKDPTVGAHSPTTGFNPHPTHSEVPQICGRCHSDAGYMRHLNARLPVGQEALFSLSLHGKLTAAGDNQAPNCASCHGRHEILPPSSPLSPVNRANVSKVCAGCHSDPKRMVRYQIPTDQVSKWERSVHGQAFAKGNPNAPTCTGCHGAHSATPPEASSVARSCGRCHDDELKFFEQSPHSKAFRKRGLAECVACHGNHDITSPTALMVGTGADATCMKCHSKDDKPRQVADQISTLLREARGRAEAARTAVAKARASGLLLPGASFALDRIATGELKLRGVVHTLDPARLAEHITAVDEAAVEAQKLITDAEQTRKTERRGYYVALALAALLFVSLMLKSLDLERRRRA